MSRRFNPFTFIRDQYTTLPQLTANLQGRVVIVTGANSGIGYQAASQLYDLQPKRLILAQRSLQKGHSAVQSLLQAKAVTRVEPKDNESSNTPIVEAWELDLNDFSSVKTFAQRANKELDRLDILIQNAGIRTLEWNMTKDGWESSLQANVISTGFLSLLLLPLMSRTASLPPLVAASPLNPRLVIVSSYMHALADFPEHKSKQPLQALNDKNAFNPSDRYKVTKLLSLFITRELAKLSSASSVKVSAVDPGFTYSNLRRESRSVGMSLFEALLARKEDMGARNYLWAALEDSYESGSYISNCRVEPVSPFIDSPSGQLAQQQVWDELKAIWLEISKVSPQVILDI